MQIAKVSEIKIAHDRQRKELNADALLELANSIADTGLIHPIVINRLNGEFILVAGERRLRAAELLYGMGQTFKFAGKLVPEDNIPVVAFQDLDSIDAFEIELEENIKRSDLTWQERSTATSQLYELRRLQARKKGLPEPETAAFAAATYPDKSPQYAHQEVREELILARHLKDPDVARASSAREGIKVIKRKEEAAKVAALGESIGRTFSRASHALMKGDCTQEMSRLPDSLYDVILTDPPYGIDAQDFNDSGGKADAAGHTYDDSVDNWRLLMRVLARESYRLAKPQAHAYIFCDVDNFCELRELFRAAGWRPFRTPFIWHNPTSQRAPWPQHGPHRRYQLCMYAVKGDRPTLKLAPDLVTYVSDTNVGWAAQKPVGLYTDLLARSCRPGDSVIDPFCGSGTIFPAAHSLRIKATGIEMDPTAYGIAIKRLGELR